MFFGIIIIKFVHIVPVKNITSGQRILTRGRIAGAGFFMGKS